MSVATQLLASLIDSDDGVDQFVNLALKEEFFRGPLEINLFKACEDHIKSYGVLPSRATLGEFGWADLEQTHEPAQFYADRVYERFLHYKMKEALETVQNQLNSDQPFEAMETMIHQSLELTRSRYRNRMINFATDGMDVIAAEFKKKKLQGDDYGLRLGWPSFDNLTDGLSGGDLVTFVGRPASGKTYLLLYAASRAWIDNDKAVLFISMEMKPLPIVQRLAALNAKKPITALKKAELSTAAEADLFEKMAAYKDKAPFYVVDGALTATMADIIGMARQLKPQVVFIDGAYLVRADNPKLQRWDRTSEVLEAAKSQLAEAPNIPVVISFQFNREVKGKAVGGLENIAYTDAVGQLSSVVLGLGLGEDADSVESIYTRHVEIL